MYLRSLESADKSRRRQNQEARNQNMQAVMKSLYITPKELDYETQ